MPLDSARRRATPFDAVARRLRVLFAGDTRSPFTERLAAALVRRGTQVAVLNGRHMVDRVRWQYGAALEDVSCAERRFRGNGRIAAVRRFEGCWNRRRLFRGMERARADVIHLHNLYCGERLDRLADLPRLPAPLVVTAWGSDVDDSVVRKHPSYPPLRLALLSRASLITASSEPMVRRCRALVPERPARDFRMIHWFPEPDRFHGEAAQRGREHWRRRLGIAPNDFVVLSPRGTSANYQIDRIIRAFAQAFPGSFTETARRAVLVILHSSDAVAFRRDCLRQLRALALPLGDRVRFVEQVAYTEVAGLYGLADVAVSIPKADGAAATHFELMALGIPLITAPREDYRGIVLAGQNAAVVDATTDESVACALRELAENADLYGRIRAGALASAARHGTFDDTVDAYLQVYRDVLAPPPVRAAAGETADIADEVCAAAS